jgi:hypothetical protein
MAGEAVREGGDDREGAGQGDAGEALSCGSREPKDFYQKQYYSISYVML